MPVTVACSSCRTPLTVPDNLIGRPVRCPKCNTAQLVVKPPPLAIPVPSPLPPERHAITLTPGTLEPASQMAVCPESRRDHAERTPGDDQRPIPIIGGVVAAILLLIAVVAVVVGNSRKENDGKPPPGPHWVDDEREALARVKADVARVKAGEVAKALMVYKIDHDNWPADLTALTRRGEHGGPYISEEDLLDPWGNRYRFDPAGPRNNGAKPDVYTTSPSGQVIGNWPR